MAPSAAQAPPSGASWAALVPAAAAKRVKDALKKAGWLDQGLKVGSPQQFGGRIAFPLLPTAAEAARAACARREPPVLAEVDAIEQVQGLVAAHRPPPQGKKAAAASSRQAPAQRRAGSAQPRSFGRGAAQAAGSELPPAGPVRRIQCPPRADNRWLCEHVTGRREPAVLRGLDLGPCVGGWTPQRLARARCSCEEVSVHVCALGSDDQDGDGQAQPPSSSNFVFRSMPFREAVTRCATYPSGPPEPEPELAPLLRAGERYYLRSVGVDPRKHASDFPALFPDLAPECSLLLPALRPEPEPEREPLLDPASYHSSVLRLASDDTQLWTHFDIMDNVLAQVTGRKRVVLWPPSQDEHLYVRGSSSRIPDIDSWNDAEFPLFRRSVPHRTECELEPGDVLYIPALWFHNVTSIGFSVGVNVFWRGHGDSERKGKSKKGKEKSRSMRVEELYDRKDLYVRLTAVLSWSVLVDEGVLPTAGEQGPSCCVAGVGPCVGGGGAARQAAGALPLLLRQCSLVCFACACGVR